MVSDFYTPFHEGVEHTLENAERAVGERALGTDPETGKPVIARMGRYGPMVQIGVTEGEEKAKFAKLKASQSIETISFEDAMELFKLGAPLGEFEGQEITVNIGRFGPYVKFGDQFVSIPRGEEPGTVDLERAIELIKAKRIEDAPVATYDAKPVTKGKGRFGPFIKWNDMFINVPARYNFDNLTQADINQLIEAKLVKEANRFIQQWPEEKIAIENGRWGPEAVYNKKRIRLPKGKYTAEALATISLDEVKAMILAQDPKAFDKKKAPAKKTATKAAAKKAPAKKAAPKKK
jgi:DNA topoisomerase-1